MSSHNDVPVAINGDCPGPVGSVRTSVVASFPKERAVRGGVLGRVEVVVAAVGTTRDDNVVVLVCRSPLALPLASLALERYKGREGTG